MRIYHTNPTVDHTRHLDQRFEKYDRKTVLTSFSTKRFTGYCLKSSESCAKYLFCKGVQNSWNIIRGSSELRRHCWVNFQYISMWTFTRMACETSDGTWTEPFFSEQSELFSGRGELFVWTHVNFFSWAKWTFFWNFFLNEVNFFAKLFFWTEHEPFFPNEVNFLTERTELVF